MGANPNDRKYSKSHEWFLVQGDVVTVGITKFAADELTDITFVDLPKVGSAVTAGQPFCQVESVKATSDVYSFVTGTIVEINEALSSEPGLINSDSFDQGWIAKIEAGDLGGLTGCMDSAAYQAMLNAG
ncbi:MAG TPA: glycine cleavage system protein GcvH [Phycisphaerae bacterium]|nr:glycine cleavage system protein GcvH [Phycisphaerae bacterium]